MKNPIFAFVLLSFLTTLSAHAKSIDCTFKKPGKKGYEFYLKGTIDSKNELELTELSYDDGTDMLGNYQSTESPEVEKEWTTWKTIIPSDDNDYGDIFTLNIKTSDFRSKKEFAAVIYIGGYGRDGDEYVREELDGECTLQPGKKDFIEAELPSNGDLVQLASYAPKKRKHYSSPVYSSPTSDGRCPKGKVARAAGTMGGVVCVPKNVFWPIGCPEDPWAVFCKERSSYNNWL